MIKRFLIVFGSSVIQKASVFVMMIFSARIMGVYEFGQFAFVYATAVSLTGFLGDSLAATANRYVPLYKSSKTSGYEMAQNLIMLSLIISACVFFIIVISALGMIAFVKQHNIFQLLLWAGPFSFFQLQNTVFNSVINSLNKNEIAALISCLGGLLAIVCGLAGASYYGINGMCLGYTLGLAIITLSYYVTTMSNLLSISIGHFNVIKRILIGSVARTFILPTMATMGLGGPIHWFCLSLLATTGANGVSDLAIFTLFFQWFTLLNFIPSALCNFTVPWLVKKRELDELVFIRSAMKVLFFAAIIGGGLLIGIWLIKSEILLLYGSELRKHGNVLVLLSACGVLGAFITLMTQILWVSGKSWSNFYIACIYAVSYVFAAFLLVKVFLFGANGLGMAFLFATAIQGGIQLNTLRGTFKLEKIKRLNYKIIFR